MRGVRIIGEKTGLSQKEVEQRIKQGKVNGSVNRTSKTYGEIIRENVFTFFNGLNVMLAAAILYVHSYRNLLFMGVVLWNTGIGIVQEIRTKRLLDKMALLLESKVKVWRDRKLCSVDTSRLVMDDVVEFHAGEQVCVDGCILEGNCEVDESMLTGESEPVKKQAGDSLIGGCHLVSGQVTMKVTAVGMDCYANQIMMRAKTMKKNKSEIADSLEKIIKLLSVVIVPLGIAMYIKQRYSLHLSQTDAVVKTVASMISMIPDGLVLLSSLVMAVGVFRLSRKKAIVQDLYSIESLARVDVMCLDKTGTITEGTMEVEETIAIQEAKMGQEAFCAYFHAMQEENATSAALRSLVTETIEWNMVDKLAFSSARKWGAVTFEEYGTYVLGAPEQVLGKEIFSYKAIVAPYLQKGRRIVVFGKAAYAEFPENQIGPVKPYFFFVLKDKIRPHAEETFAYFQEQGVRLLLLSGDHPETVSNVGKQAGIMDADNYMDATTLTSSEELACAVKNNTVFGRVTPEQKKEIVKTLQEQGHVVAMTGDGVNDVLALKEADCSIVMDTGCDVARKTAKVILEQSDFSVVPDVLKEGRRAINNLQRSATLFLTKTTFSTLLMILFLTIHMSYPMQPIQMTLISSITIGFPAFLLALEPNVSVVRGSFIKKVLSRAVPTGMLALVHVSLIVWICSRWNCAETVRTTMTVMGVALANVFLLLHLCHPWNKKKIIMVVGVIGVFLGAIVWLEPIFMMHLPPVRCLCFLLGLAGMDFVLYVMLTAILAGIRARKMK